MKHRDAVLREFTSYDGATISFRHWPNTEQSTTKKAIVLLHRGHEHSGRLQDIVDQINLPECNIYAWDARGHGLSEGDRGYAKHFGVYVKDLDCFMQTINATDDIEMENIAVIAQSVGAVVATTWVHDYAPNIRALVLASPALRVRLYIPFAIPGLRLLNKIKPVAYIKSYVKGKLLTHNQEKAESYNQDKLVSPRIAVNILIGLYDTSTRLLKDAAAIQTPVQFLVSGADWVVEQKPQHTLFERWGAQDKAIHTFPDFYHDTLNEADGHLAVAKAHAFIQRQFAKPQQTPSLIDADKTGYTYDEYQSLRKPLPFLHPKSLFYKWFRFQNRTIGKLSKGLTLGVNTGFDSGSTLDYVYQNKAQGITPIGKMMDRTYLNSIGWQGIRVRKQHLEQLLHQAIKALSSTHPTINILDIASGHGRYILDTLATIEHDDFNALLRDYSATNVTQGRALIDQRGLNEKVTFVEGDAFDGESIATIQPSPHITVVSGLYELFADNALLRTSLNGIAKAMHTGGYLIYTNQPWHPQLELIARGLTSHRSHQAWVMRRRTQLEMDQLVQAAGFKKIDMLIDEWGIFTVSLAQKTAA